jgi:hypothetical protein
MPKERRARGEGGVRRRTDGAWEASLDLGTGLAGKRVVKWFRAPTRSLPSPAGVRLSTS